MYFGRACLDASELADQGCGAGFEDFVGASIELGGAGFDVWGGGTDGGEGEESHRGEGSCVDGGELHFGGVWIWKSGVLEFGNLGSWNGEGVSDAVDDDGE